MSRIPVLALLAASLASAQELPPRQRNYLSSVGIYHWAADRRIADAERTTVLAMGDRLVTRLGARTIRLALTPNWDYFDPVGNHCDTEGLIPKFRRENMGAVLQNPQYTTVILTVYPYAGVSCPVPQATSVACDPSTRYDKHPFLDPPAGYYDAVIKEMADFANFLYSLPGLDGKTVILSDWSGDGNFFFDCVDRTELYLRWIAARQAGVTRARQAHPRSRIQLLNAVEISGILQWRLGRVNALTALTRGPAPALGAGPGGPGPGPAPPFDLFSYQSYETTDQAIYPFCGEGQFPGQIARDVLLLDNLWTGFSGASADARARLMFGEVGYALGRTHPEQQKDLLMTAIERALAAGVARVIVWAATDNAPHDSPEDAFGLAAFRSDLPPDFFELRPAGAAARAAFAARRVTIDRAGCFRDDDADNSICNSLDWHTDNLLPGGFATVFGRGFGQNPRVELMDETGNAYAANLVYASDTQLNFLLPGAAPSGLPLAAGRTTLRVIRDDGEASPFADFDVARRTAPHINTAGILASRFETSPLGRYCYLPGEFIEIYGKFPATVKVLFDGEEAAPDFVHPQGWQINVRIPDDLPVNEPCEDVQVQVKDLNTGLVSNPVPIHLRAPGTLCPAAPAAEKAIGARQ